MTHRDLARRTSPPGSGRRAHRAVNTRYDVIIIGSGAGGGTMARALATSAGANPRRRARDARASGSRTTGIPRPCGSTCATATTERWLDGHGQEFLPYTHYGVGGNTKFWGSVLYRLRREDFQAVEHMDGVSPAWPIDYDTLEPYYDRAERLYHVHGAARHRSDRTAARTLSLRADSSRARHGRRSSTGCGDRASIPRTCRSD